MTVMNIGPSWKRVFEHDPPMLCIAGEALCLKAGCQAANGLMCVYACE